MKYPLLVDSRLKLRVRSQILILNQNKYHSKMNNQKTPISTQMKRRAAAAKKTVLKAMKMRSMKVIRMNNLRASHIQKFYLHLFLKRMKLLMNKINTPLLEQVLLPLQMYFLSILKIKIYHQ